MPYNQPMLVFIDESGDAGFKVGQGSTPVLVIACVCFAEAQDAEKTASLIKAYRASLGRPHQNEFKFSKTRKDIKTGFFKALSSAPFEVHAIVFQKDKIYSDNLRNNKGRFYSFAVRQILSTLGDKLANGNIKIDGSGDKAFKNSFTKYLRDYLPVPIAKLSFKDSKNNDLIQLADMCAGAISRSFVVSPNSNNYRDLLKPKLKNVWDFK